MRVCADRFTNRALCTLALLLAACSSGEKAPASGASAATDSTARPAPCATGTAELTLPAGFCATIFADGIKHARHVVVASNGDVYTTIEGTGPDDPTAPTPDSMKSTFVALRDTTHDGKADVVVRVGKLGNTGIGLHGGYLYVEDGARVLRYARADSQLVPTGQPEVIVDGLPTKGHRARNFVFGSDSAIYVNVGSPSNSCQVKDRADGSPGKDPCGELATRAGIWKFDANKPGQHFSPTARFATGIRNGMGLDFGPDGKLYATQHGRDQFYQNWPKLFPDPKYSAANPAEELLQVNQ
ncbi:MAG: L-sorbosone dehydrogenase, partial [Gemmatimonadetes bacterium]|nr:L-sorbosone dehydrogenase [Gemmatimonadota bacterium]